LDRAIADSGAKLFFFDEIQSAERWELYVRQKLDEGFQGGWMLSEWLLKSMILFYILKVLKG